MNEGAPKDKERVNMGIFDKLKSGKNGNKVNDVNQENKTQEDVAHGWRAIEHTFSEIYPGQIDPKHYGTLISWKFGGNDPLDGISIYDAGDYWHFVTFGLSELYEKETTDLEWSGFGVEFTFKLKKDNFADEEAEIKGICGILQHIARITFTENTIFQPFEYLYTGQKSGIDTQMKSNITGFITILDQQAGKIQTPNGNVEFVQFIGVTDNELQALLNKEMNVSELFEKLGTDVTDYQRGSVL